MEDLRSNVHGWKISPPVVGWGWLQKELNPQVHNIKKTVSIHWIMEKDYYYCYHYYIDVIYI